MIPEIMWKKNRGTILVEYNDTIISTQAMQNKLHQIRKRFMDA